MPYVQCSICGDLRYAAASRAETGIVCHACRRQRREDLKAARSEAWRPVEHVCTCGEVFTGLPDRRRCDDCRENINSLGSRPHRGSWRKRARFFNVPYEQIDALLVFERDEWMCGLCGDPVDRLLKSPNPMCASLDHIVPMSRGGGHTYDNVQCAHWICNVRKGADDVARGRGGQRRPDSDIAHTAGQAGRDDRLMRRAPGHSGVERASDRCAGADCGGRAAEDIEARRACPKAR